LDKRRRTERRYESSEREKNTEPSPASTESQTDIDHWSPVQRPVVARLAKLHCQRGFGKGERGSEQRSRPHPEHRAGSAQRDRGGNANDLADADLAGQCSGESFQRWNLTRAIRPPALPSELRCARKSKNWTAAKQDHDVGTCPQRREHHRRDGHYLMALPCAAPEQIPHGDDEIVNRHDAC
jgi:hypothetical protein